MQHYNCRPFMMLFIIGARAWKLDDANASPLLTRWFIRTLRWTRCFSPCWNHAAVKFAIAAFLFLRSSSGHTSGLLCGMSRTGSAIASFGKQVTRRCESMCTGNVRVRVRVLQQCMTEDRPTATWIAAWTDMKHMRCNAQTTSAICCGLYKKY